MSSELLWLFKRAWPFRRLYLLQLSAIGAGSSLRGLEPLILKWVIDSVLPWQGGRMLLAAAGGFLAAFVLRKVFHSTGAIIDSYTTERLLLDMRQGLLRHLQRLPVDYYLHTPRGQILHRLEQDAEQVAHLGLRSLGRLVHVAALGLVSIGVMLSLNWRLTLMILPLLLLMLVVRRISAPYLREVNDTAQRASADRVAFLESHLSAMTHVQLFNRMAGERLRFVRIARRFINAAVERRKVELAFSVCTDGLWALGMAITLGYGGQKVLEGSLTIGGLVAIFSYMARIFQPMEILVQIHSDLHRALAGLRRVKSLLEIEPKITDPSQPCPIPGKGPIAVRIRDMSFAYQRNDRVLRNIDLEIRPGEKVALVGASGCGKSSIAKLLLRLHDAQQGQITLNGVDVRDMRLKELRSQVALVPQEPVLFDATLRQNLLYAAPGKSEAELSRILCAVQLESLLEELPHGWEEPVGERGKRLSGGQRQRVAIAGALLRNPRLLILDEATSALDAPTEERLLESLKPCVRGRTVILIAHRPAAIRWADRAVLLDCGRIVTPGQSRLDPRFGLVPLPVKEAAQRANLFTRKAHDAQAPPGRWGQ